MNYGSSVILPSNEERGREFGRIAPYFMRRGLKFITQHLKAICKVWVVVNSERAFMF